MEDSQKATARDVLEGQVIRLKKGRMNRFGFEPAWNSYFDFYLSAKYVEKPLLQLEDVTFHLFLRKNLNDGDPHWLMPSYNQIKWRFGISQDKLQAMLRRLEQAHLLQKVSGKRRGANRSNVTNEYILSDPIQELELFLTVAAAGEFAQRLKAEWKARDSHPTPKSGVAPTPIIATPPTPKSGEQQQTSLLQTSIKQQQQGLGTAENVVVALTHKGISKKVAAELAAKYPETLILQKIELLEFLGETQSPLAAKNPAGYLRKAIEDDYQPPKGFKTKAQREAERQQQAALERLEREREAAEAQRRHEAKAAWRAHVIADYHVSAQQLQLSEQVISVVQADTFHDGLRVWLGNALLVSRDDGTATFAIPYEYPSSGLAAHMAAELADALSAQLNQPVAVQFAVVRPDEGE